MSCGCFVTLLLVIIPFVLQVLCTTFVRFCMGLIVPGAVWAVAASMWAVTSSMSDVIASMYDVHALCVMYMCYVGCDILYV